jgi:parallel beta-helix repeat protein
VTDHYGMHANGLTFYLGCKDLLVEGNEVYDSNIGLTIQDAEDVIIRNNIIDSGGKSLCVGIWTATPLRNVRFLNNLLLRASAEHPWHAALFSNSRGPEGLVVKNNVIDGLSGNLPGQFSHNIYTRWGPNQEDHELGPGEIHQPDLKKIFVDPENRDFRLRAGSPAIDAGAAVEGGRDFDGNPRPQGKAIDIGPHEYKGR